MYLLELVGEADDLARREAASAATGVEALAPGLATARGLADARRVRGLALVRRASELVGSCEPAVEDAVALLEAAGVDRRGSVAVRAVDVRGATDVADAAAERRLGSVLVDRGFSVDLEDPDHVLRAAFAEGRAALGWLAVASVRDFGDRAPTDRPFFQPGSMDPLLARAIANVAGARPGARVVDPMCGTGGVLVEAGLVGANVVGVDAQAKMARGARRNLARYLGDGVDGLPDPGEFGTLRGDATRLPLADGAADGVVFDVPYGRQSKVANRSLEGLVGDALAEAARLAPGAVVVGDRDWAGAARDAGWTVTDRFERRVHRSLTRHVHVLE